MPVRIGPVWGGSVEEADAAFCDAGGGADALDAHAVLGHGGIGELDPRAPGLEHAGGEGVGHQDQAADLGEAEGFASWLQALEGQDLVDAVDDASATGLSPSSGPRRCSSV